MQFLAAALFRKVVYIFYKILYFFDHLLVWVYLYLSKVKFSKFTSTGIPLVRVAKTGTMNIGAHFKMNNRENANPIGRFNRCSFVVGDAAVLQIGNYVGISSTHIVCRKQIKIGDYVKIGGNVVIYDTDFHSLQANERKNHETDMKHAVSTSVTIGNHAFIGAHTTILKGVKIGDRSIIGACSVVTRDIPADQIWAGNPAKFIKNLN